MAKKKQAPHKLLSDAGGRRIYKNPPILEATCEFVFSDDSEWNIAYSGLFLQRVRDRYSGRPEEQQMIVPGQTVQFGLDPAPIRTVTRVRIPDLDDKNAVAIAANRLSIHTRKPYIGWPAYRERISALLADYVAIGHPKALSRVGIRYINKIDSPSPGVSPAKYIHGPATKLGSLDADLYMFVQRREYRFNDRAIKALITTSTLDPPPDNPNRSYLVDIDVMFEALDVPAKIDLAMDIVDDLRSREREVFELLITDDARGLFDA